MIPPVCKEIHGNERRAKVNMDSREIHEKCESTWSYTDSATISEEEGVKCDESVR